jgi:hypothetical protein
MPSSAPPSSNRIDPRFGHLFAKQSHFTTFSLLRIPQNRLSPAQIDDFKRILNYLSKSAQYFDSARRVKGESFQRQSPAGQSSSESRNCQQSLKGKKE